MPIAPLLASALLAAPVQPAWVEEFQGNPSFGFVTSVQSVGKQLLFADSPAPAGANGGDVYVMDKAGIRKVYEVDEQGISVIRRYGNRVYIPGVDATEDWTLGNFYTSTDKGETWQKFRNIPLGVHIFDIAEWRGDLYVSTGSVDGSLGYASVWKSEDGGQSWTESLVALPIDALNQFARSYLLLPMEDGLYAHYASLFYTGFENQSSPHDFHRFDGNEWAPVKVLPAFARTGYYGFKGRVMGDGKYALIASSPQSYMLHDGMSVPLLGLENRTTFDFVAAPDGYVYAVSRVNATFASALYRCSLNDLENGVPVFQHVLDLPSGQEGLAMDWHKGRLYVGTKATGGGRLLSLDISGL